MPGTRLLKYTNLHQVHQFSTMFIRQQQLSKVWTKVRLHKSIEKGKNMTKPSCLQEKLSICNRSHRTRPTYCLIRKHYRRHRTWRHSPVQLRLPKEKVPELMWKWCCRWTTTNDRLFDEIKTDELMTIFSPPLTTTYVVQLFSNL